MQPLPGTGLQRFRKFARESRFSKKKSAKHGKSRGIRKIQGPQSLSNFRCANTLIPSLPFSSSLVYLQFFKISREIRVFLSLPSMPCCSGWIDCSTLHKSSSYFPASETYRLLKNSATAIQHYEASRPPMVSIPDGYQNK